MKKLTQLNINRIKNLFFLFAFIGLAGVLVSFSIQDDKWTAPAEADKMENPFSNDEKAVKVGQKIFKKLCWSCHGLSGTGDGPAGMYLNPSPGNFTTDEFQSQSDGAIYWKLTNGRGNMASYESTITDDDRWKLVNYIRTFKK